MNNSIISSESLTPQDKDNNISPQFDLGQLNDANEYREKECEEKLSKRYFRKRTFDEVIADGAKEPDRKKIFGAFLRHSTNTFFFSRTNYGKSLLASNIAMAAATGISVNDCQALMNECDPMRVLMVDLENDDKTTFDRHSQVIRQLDPELLKNLIYLHESLDSEPVFRFELLKKIEDAAIENEAELIILDNISKILPDLLKAEEVAQVIEFMKRIKLKTGASFFVIGHTTKGDPRIAISPTSYYGSAALQNFFTEIFFLDATINGKFFLCHSKTKYKENYTETVPVFSREETEKFGLGFTFESLKPVYEIKLPDSFQGAKSRKENFSDFKDEVSILEKNGVSRKRIADLCNVNKATVTKLLSG